MTPTAFRTGPITAHACNSLANADARALLRHRFRTIAIDFASWLAETARFASSSNNDCFAAAAHEWNTALA